MPSEFLLDIDEVFIESSEITRSGNEKGKVIYLD
jgi:hypothetical protein